MNSHYLKSILTPLVFSKHEIALVLNQIIKKATTFRLPLLSKVNSDLSGGFYQFQYIFRFLRRNCATSTFPLFYDSSLRCFF